MCTQTTITLITKYIGQFRKRASLGGHTDWIRCLAFSPPISDSSGTNHLLLASGAQDGYVRLWRVKRLQEELKDDLQLDELDLETRTHPFPARSEEYVLCLAAALN